MKGAHFRKWCSIALKTKRDTYSPIHTHTPNTPVTQDPATILPHSLTHNDISNTQAIHLYLPHMGISSLVFNSAFQASNRPIDGNSINLTAAQQLHTVAKKRKYTSQQLRAARDKDGSIGYST